MIVALWIIAVCEVIRAIQNMMQLAMPPPDGMPRGSTTGNPTQRDGIKRADFLNAIDDAYAKGVCAGTMQQKLTDHEDQNRRLNELYRMGYERGYGEGAFDTKCEIGEIDLPVVDDIGEALEEV